MKSCESSIQPIPDSHMNIENLLLDEQVDELILLFLLAGLF